MLPIDPLATIAKLPVFKTSTRSIRRAWAPGPLCVFVFSFSPTPPPACEPRPAHYTTNQLRTAQGRHQVKSSQGTNSRPPEWQLRKLRVPLETPGDVGENALGAVPPLSCKVCTRRPTLGLPPSGDKDDDTPAPPPPRYQGRDGRGVWSSGNAPTLSQPERDWAVPGWPADRHTRLGRAGLGNRVKGRALPRWGSWCCPPSQ